MHHKYTINLYVEDLKPKVYYLTLTNTVLVAIVTLFVMFGWSFLLDGKLEDKQQRLAIIQQQVKSAQDNLQQLQQALIKHNDKATFNNRKKVLETDLEAKQLLWDGVGKRLTASTVDYYLLMKELTEHHEHSLWLSHFTFNENDVLFKGYALDSSAVTQWMTYLQATKSFADRELSHLNVKAVNDKILSFQVATDATLVAPEVGTDDE